MNKMSETKKIILNFLNDSCWHSVTEIKTAILNVNKDLLTDKNFIYVVLNDLKVKRGKIESNGTGMYRIKPPVISSSTDLLSVDNSDRKKVINGWKHFYEKTINQYQLSLEMSEEEFRKAKWLYELNKEMENLILTFKS